MCIRLHNDDSLFETLARIAAARTAGCDFVVSVPNDLSNPVTSFLEHRYGQALLKKGQMIYESDEHLAEKLHSIDRIRYAAPERVPDGLFREAAKNGFLFQEARYIWKAVWNYCTTSDSNQSVIIITDMGILVTGGDLL